VGRRADVRLERTLPPPKQGLRAPPRLQRIDDPRDCPQYDAATASTTSTKRQIPLPKFRLIGGFPEESSRIVSECHFLRTSVKIEQNFCLENLDSSRIAGIMGCLPAEASFPPAAIVARSFLFATTFHAHLCLGGMFGREPDVPGEVSLLFASRRRPTSW
jgi:hypothetical protein